ncbi:hypothetical protein ACIBVL_26815 [Streptomyces sp. NPDC049687]|uniref:hypothetical protein n=1 Tax=Streptomyces sp. NPDC049687 TaxID=3365596 RepID=UPI0037ADFE74
MHATPRPRRAGARTAALAALVVAGSALTAPAAVAAPMAPGDNGTVKIHRSLQGPDGTKVGDPRDDPRVCSFYLDAANFDTVQNITWTIETQPLDPNGASLEGEIDLAGGVGHTEDLILPDGQYKLVWVITGGGGTGKEKVFTVDCTTPPTSPPPTTAPPTTRPHHGGPHGGPPAGGGGIARDAALGPVAGAAAVGVAAVGGVVWFRLRRRPHGAA